MAEPDVTVAGAGPAGLTAALLLARRGYRVHLYEKRRFPRRCIGESLAPGIHDLLEWLGLREAVDAAGFIHPRSALVAWDSLVEHVYQGETARLVDRAVFDSILLDAAERAGVRVTWGPLPNRPASFLIDATGRRGIISGRRIRLGPPLLALYAYWRGVTLPGEGAVVEAAAEEWFWAAPLPGGCANVMVFLEPSRARFPHIAYREALTRFTTVGNALQSGSHDAVKALDASSWTALEPCGERFLKTGEAAFSVDALSSQGVQLAMQSGIQAAAVVNTIFRCGDGALAREFYRSRQLSAAIHNHRIACGYYSMLRQRGAFWTRRSIPVGLNPPDPPAARLIEDRIVAAPVARLSRGMTRSVLS